MTNKELQDKIDAQKAFCKETGNPHFAPYNGVCWSCGRQIYEEISLERVQAELITSCPWCHHSYCD